MIVNPIKEVLENIPELSEIKDTSLNKEFVSNKNWYNKLKIISTKNLKKYRQAATATSLNNYFNPCIICIHDDKTLEINREKYTLIRDYVMSEKYHK